MSATPVRRFVLAHLAEPLREAGLDPETVSGDTDLLGDGVIDSFAVLDLMAAVGDEFGIDGEWEEYPPEEILVLDAFCRFVERHASTP